MKPKTNKQTNKHTHTHTHNNNKKKKKVFHITERHLSLFLQKRKFLFSVAYRTNRYARMFSSVCRGQEKERKKEKKKSSNMSNGISTN